jgi:hypothetical protein
VSLSQTTKADNVLKTCLVAHFAKMWLCRRSPIYIAQVTGMKNDYIYIKFKIFFTRKSRRNRQAKDETPQA